MLTIAHGNRDQCDIVYITEEGKFYLNEWPFPITFIANNGTKTEIEEGSEKYEEICDWADQVNESREMTQEEKDQWDSIFN